jgi:phosphoglycolate phosphatase-like HAD superfamily hydrolase
VYKKLNYKKYHFNIILGIDKQELRYLCKELAIDRYFLSIHGSPTPKKQWVKDLLNFYNYNLPNTYLICDSINDYEAALAKYIL